MCQSAQKETGDITRDYIAEETVREPKSPSIACRSSSGVHLGRGPCLRSLMSMPTLDHASTSSVSR